VGLTDGVSDVGAWVGSAVGSTDGALLGISVNGDALGRMEGDCDG